eukprot:CAMPEP_0196589272 /NCGR_PEP_ID=MMETSP1081-20130531/63159_1 /TAXON_ID=36882 /ORGANISM="Pyramimonas amylifera, Strain CCMP720" /LENGTH=343 /DNA_ID=CAMNT_0041912029 /DNA_START=151 /DNA_END=1182 /DNA_ORIENTATION=-
MKAPVPFPSPLEPPHSLFRPSFRAAATCSGSGSSVEFPVPTVSSEWLQQNLACVQVVDASWYMPNVNRNPKEEFLQCRIPGAVFFDLDGVRDVASPLPHMLPPAPAFAAAAQALNISNSTHVVVYDCSGLFSAARAWWMFKVFGHQQVSVLEGGLPGWLAKGCPFDSTPPTIPPEAGGAAAQSAQEDTWEQACGGCYIAHLDQDVVKTMEQMMRNLDVEASARNQVVDARSKGRFTGKAPEPRPGVKGGHIPHSCNVPFEDVLRPGGFLKSVEDLKTVFTSSGLKLDGAPIIASCGTGVTACVLALALQKLGVGGVSVYDGSWTEWGSSSTNTLIKIDGDIGN